MNAAAAKTRRVKRDREQSGDERAEPVPKSGRATAGRFKSHAWHPSSHMPPPPDLEFVFELGRRLREVREELGLSQQQVAEAGGIAPEVVSRLENAHYQSPGLRTIWRVARGLGVSVADVLPTDDDAQPVRLHERPLLAMMRSVNEQDLKLVLGLVAAVLAHGKTSDEAHT